MKTPVWCRKKAAEVGSACAQVVEELLSGEYALHHLRSAQGVLGLAGRGDELAAARLEDACRRALAAGEVSYRTIKAILTSTAERPLPAPEPAASPVRRSSGATGYLRGPQAFIPAPPPEAAADHSAAAPQREEQAGTVVAFRPRTRAS